MVEEKTTPIKTCHVKTFHGFYWTILQALTTKLLAVAALNTPTSSRFTWTGKGHGIVAIILMILPNFFLVTIDLVIHMLRALLCSSMPTARFTHCRDVNGVNMSNTLSKRNVSRLISSMLYCRNYTWEIPIVNEEKQLNLFANIFNVNRIW